MGKKTIFLLILCLLSGAFTGIKAQEKSWPLTVQVQEIVLYKNIPQVLHASAMLSKKRAKNINYEIQNGKILTQKGAKLIILAEQIGQTTLLVKKKNKVIAKKIFTVLPRPEVTIALNKEENNAQASNMFHTENIKVIPTRKINLERGASADALLKVNIEVDAAFLLLHPEKCNYRIKKMEATLFRGGRSIANLELNDNTLNLENLPEQAGDGIQIKVTEAVRVDASGQEIREKLSNPYLSFFIL